MFVQFSYDTISRRIMLHIRHWVQGRLISAIIINYCQLINAGKSITLIWIPGHTGIQGNERADDFEKTLHWSYMCYS